MGSPQSLSGTLSLRKRRPPMELRNPTSKGFKGPRFISYLPICQDSSDKIYSNDYEWPLFTGKFNGNSIIIDDVDEVIALSNKGFFGKGSLSRGTPSVCKRKSTTKLVTESQWKRRQTWSTSLSAMLHDQLAKSQIHDLVLVKTGCPSLKEVQSNSVHSERIGSKINGSSNLEDKVDNDSNTHREDNPVSDLEENNKMDLSGSKEGWKSNETDANDINLDESATTCSKDDTDNLSSVKSVVIFKNDTKDIGPLPISDSSLRNKDNKLLEDDELLVINDLGINLDESLNKLNPHIEKEKVKTVLEVLYLSFEEAFFLSYSLNCLQVIDLAQNYLSNKALWRLCRETQPDFIEKYVAYHHFRSKGWVVKSGLKFGGDFLLYKKGPSYYHASYIVLVKLLKPDGTTANGNKSLTWGDMLTLNRMSESATKEVLVCEVMKPDLPEEYFLEPDVLKEFKVGELLLRRWHPSNDNDSPIQSSQ